MASDFLSIINPTDPSRRQQSSSQGRVLPILPVRSTVLRTGRIGSTLPWGPPVSRRLGSVGLMMLKKSLAMSILLSDYLK